MKVSAWVMTSSPRSTPATTIAMWSAAVPLTVATPYLAPQYAATPCSNSVTRTPTDETKLESMHSTKYLFSLPEKTGRCSAIDSLLYIPPTNSFNSSSINRSFIIISRKSKIDQHILNSTVKTHPNDTKNSSAIAFNQSNSCRNHASYSNALPFQTDQQFDF